MSETARDAKLLQYLNEAYAKERELEAALQAHIGMTTRKPYAKRLREHLSETKDHAARSSGASSSSAARGLGAFRAWPARRWARRSRSPRGRCTCSGAPARPRRC